MAIGASLGGLLADRVGRRSVFALTLLVYGLATGASALSWSVGSLLVLRFVVGLGLGAELPVASTLVSEFAPPRIRGRIIVLLEAFWAVGWTVAALIGYFVVPPATTAGAGPSRWAPSRRCTPPWSGSGCRSRCVSWRPRAGTPRPSARSAGSSARRSAAAIGRTPRPPRCRPRRRPPRRPRAASARCGRAPSAGAPASLWLVWFCVNFSYYGAFIWLPTLLVADGFSLVRSFGFTLVITLAQLPGIRGGRRPGRDVGPAPDAGRLPGRFGGRGGDVRRCRRRDHGAGRRLLLSFFNLGAWGALYAVTPEIYPTALRATGSGWAAGVGRIASVLAPLAVPPIREWGGTGLLFAIFGAVFLVAAAGALGLPERRAQVLQD